MDLVGLGNPSYRELKGREKVRELLDVIAKGCNCYYVSDLKYKDSYSSAFAFLHTVEPSDYTVSEWQEVFLYITGSPSNYVNSLCIRSELLMFLSHV